MNDNDEHIIVGLTVLAMALIMILISKATKAESLKEGFCYEELQYEEVIKDGLTVSVKPIYNNNGSPKQCKGTL